LGYNPVARWFNGRLSRGGNKSLLHHAYGWSRVLRAEMTEEPVL